MSNKRNGGAVEAHIYEDERGDTGPDWGVYLEPCAVCGKPLAVVAKTDRVDAHDGIVLFLCRAHDPRSSEIGG